MIRIGGRFQPVRELSNGGTDESATKYLKPIDFTFTNGLAACLVEETRGDTCRESYLSMCFSVTHRSEHRSDRRVG